MVKIEMFKIKNEQIFCDKYANVISLTNINTTTYLFL